LFVITAREVTALLFSADLFFAVITITHKPLHLA